jgi:hypothetical protein
MKLSKKGQIKIGESLCIFGRSLAGSRATALAQLAFEPDDFDGVVVLTVEEAKLVTKALAFASCTSFANSEIYFAFFKEMEKRIKQMEEK